MSRLSELKAITASKKNKTRKDLEKDLKSANKAYSKAKSDYEKLQSEIIDLKSQLDDLELRADAARSLRSECGLDIKTILEDMTRLDLSGADSIDGDAVIVKGKKFWLDHTDMNEINLIPYKEYKKSKSDSNKADDSEFYESELDKDLMPHLVDDYYMELDEEAIKNSFVINNALEMLKRS